MPLGMEVGLSPSHIVLDGDPTPPPKKEGTAAPPPLFSPCLLWPNGRPSQQLLSFCIFVLNDGRKWYVVDGADNTVEENSSIFSLIHMH